MEPSAETATHADHNYSFQSPIQNSIIKQSPSHQGLCSKTMKSASTQMV